MNVTDSMNLQGIAERLTRRSFPWRDERVTMQRIAAKIERAFERLPLMYSPGAQAVTRCNGVLRYDFGKLVVETGQLAIVEAIPELPTPKELVN